MMNLNKSKYFSATLTILIFGLVYSVQSQNLSTIETTELTIGKGRVSLQDSKEIVTSAFGPPSAISTKHGEM